MTHQRQTPAASEALRDFLDAWDSGALKPEYDPEGVLADRMWQAVEQLRDSVVVGPEQVEAIREARRAVYVTHGHWDSSGGSGAGCDTCRRQRAGLDSLDAALAPLLAEQEPKKKS